MMDTLNLKSRGNRLLAEASGYYAALHRFRADRDRNKRYNYGDQWSDLINVDGRYVTEEQYIKQQGNIPLKNNLIRRLVRNVIGVYNSRSQLPTAVARDAAECRLAKVMTALLQYNMQINRSSALYTRSLEEFLISGMVVHKKNFCRRGSRTDCFTDYVQPNSFFVDNMMRDFRAWDCRAVGEIHNVPFADVCRQFASSPEHCEQLRQEFSADDDTSMCQVTELWRREIRSRYSGGDDPQWGIDEQWRYYYLSPAGSILREGDTPFDHGGHPYVFKIYPMIDGEVHSFVSDVIDQQRYTNRLITLYDWIMRASSKGVLLVPEDCIPAGHSPDDFADAWSRYNGVIVYKPSYQGAVPQQVANNSTNIGIRELLDIQLKLFEDISGVNPALQGKSSNVGISAELYGQQTHNATTTLLDVLDTFAEFVRDCAVMDMHNIRQFYSPRRIRQIVGDDACLDGMQDVEFDLSLTPDLATPTFSQSNNAVLMEIWKSGQITLEQMLRAGNFSFADTLLQHCQSPK